MSKIPVLATIRAAYGFTFHHLGAIIGAIWLPMVIVTVAGFFVLHGFLGAAIDMLSGANPSAVGPALLVMIVYLVAALLLYAVMYVAITQLALGVRKTGVIVLFAFGPPERRMFRALLALTGLCLVLAGAALLVVMVILALAPAAGLRLSQMEASALLSLGAYAVMAVLVPRFGLLLPAIGVAEETPVLRRAWELSAGNFLALLALVIAVLAPGFVIAQLASQLLPSAPLPPGVSGTAEMIALFRQEQAMLPALTGIGFFVSPLTLGLIAGGSVAAWRALAGTRPEGAPK